MNRTEAAEPLLWTENLCKRYPDGRVEALQGVNLRIGHGDYVAIMGPSGCGKSTLLNLLGGLDMPSSGQVFFAGRPLPHHRQLDDYRARQLGFVFQSFCLIPTLTALENVQVPLFETRLAARDRVARAKRLLAEVDLLHRLHHLPRQLSVGERQRVAIARALANEPKLVLADEPTGNLDSRRTDEILDLFDALRSRHDLTLVVVTHSSAVAARAARTVEMRDGQLVADRPRLRWAA